MAKCTNAFEYKIQQCSLLTPKTILKTLQDGCFQKARYSSTLESLEVNREEDAQKKILKVAILGLPNSGKSTLINQIIKLNLCDISCRTHTTQIPLRAAYISGNTQIVFVDTPGIVIKKEIKRFKLSNAYVKWKKTVIDEVDVIGVVYDATYFLKSDRLNYNLKITLEEISNFKNLIFLVNKVDLVKDKVSLLKATKKLNIKSDNEKSESSEPKDKINFDEIFYISALKDKGVTEVINYLLEKAKPGKWLLNPQKMYDIPLHVLVKNLLRAGVMNAIFEEIPYICDYEVEYLEENELGEYICVALIICKKASHMKIIIKKKRLLSTLSKTLESQLYKICRKVFRLRIVVVKNT